ncbi:MAG: GyrI-like domain-containing protein [Saprospiraceae bacterium]
MKNSETFHIIGIDIRTSNQEGKAGQDIPSLWNRFLSQNLMGKIPNKIGSEIFCIYTEYEGDHNLPYTCLLGCKVDNLDNVPEGMRGMTFTTQKLEKFTAKGNLQQGAVWKKWLEIWEAELDRTYTFDIEVYSEKAQNPEDAEVDIYISVN